MKATIATLSGDGIGPEVMVEALRVLEKIADKFGHEFTTKEALIGGIAIDETGSVRIVVRCDIIGSALSQSTEWAHVFGESVVCNCSECAAPRGRCVGHRCRCVGL